PSSSTVQAPQTPCSQPACAPVSPSRSRRQSSSEVRASTSTAQVCPLTVSSTLIGARNLGRLARIHDGAYRERDGNPPPIIRRGVQVGQRLDLGKGLLHRHAG